MAKTITIAGQKGGTGKSITAVNFAASLALLEHKTLLIDTDPQGCCTRWCGIKPEDYTFDLTSILTGRSKVADSVVKTQLGYMEVIPAGFNLFQAALKLSKNTGNEKILRLFLKDIQDKYDYIIIDSPSSYSFLTIAAMMAADNLLICMTADLNRLEDFHSQLRMVKHIREIHSVPLKISGILFNRCKTKQQIQNFITDQNLSDIKQMVFDIFIPEDITVRQAIDRAVPCALHDIKSPAAQAYLDFAKHMHCFFN